MSTTYGFLIDETKCTGCHACTITCKDKNGLDAGYNLRNVTTNEYGTIPNLMVVYSSSTCYNCENPKCLKECPTDSISKDETYGVPVTNEDTCISCGTCVKACPFDHPIMAPSSDNPNKQVKKACDFCIDLLKKGEQPACVSVCNARALEFGPIDELMKKYPEAKRLETRFNQPSVYTLVIEKKESTINETVVKEKTGIIDSIVDFFDDLF